MNTSPAPMDLPDLIAATWSACVRHWSVLLTLALAGAVMSAAAYLALLRAEPVRGPDEEITAEQAQESLRDSTPWVLAANAVLILTHLGLVRAGLTIARGDRPSLRDSAGAALRRSPAGAVSWLTILVTLSFLVFVVLVLPPAVLLMGPLALYLLVGWLLWPQAMIDEGLGPFAAMRRSRALVRGQWWRACAVGLSVVVLYIFPSIILAWVGGRLGSDEAAAACAGVATLLGAPFLALGLTYLYGDIRLRKGEPWRRLPPAEGASV